MIISGARVLTMDDSKPRAEAVAVSGGRIVAVGREAEVMALRGLDIVGADLVEVSPPFDMSGGTAWLAVNLMFEMLCAMAERVARG